MIRILIYVLLIGLLAFGFAWLADRPGDMVVTFDGYQYQVSLMMAAVIVTAIVAAIMITWWLLKALWYSPYTVTRYFRVRQRDRGYQALSSGLIAAGSGDAVRARSLKKQAAKLINSDQEPLIHLLEAQALELEGNPAGAREKYEKMLEDPEMRLLALRGLYMQAERLGDKTAARHYASKATEIAPQLGWAADETIALKTEEGEWDAALKLVEAERVGGYLDKAAAKRRKAVLLTAKAMESFEKDATGARAAALEAVKLEPTFIPAVLVAARALFRGDETRKGSKLLENAWRENPHPQVADLFTHARHGDATYDRLNRAKHLQKLRSNNVESSLIVARAALEAQELKLARSETEAALRLGPRESAYLLMADIEEAEGAGEGKVRQWLAKALRAPRDPAWVADGFISETWMPVSPVSGRIDAFEWKVPGERLAQTIEIEKAEPAPMIEAQAEIQSEPVAPREPDPEIIEAEIIVEPEPEAPAPEENPAKPALVSDDGQLARRPDDPGVDPGEPAPKRFRLF